MAKKYYRLTVTYDEHAYNPTYSILELSNNSIKDLFDILHFQKRNFRNQYIKKIIFSAETAVNIEGGHLSEDVEKSHIIRIILSDKKLEFQEPKHRYEFKRFNSKKIPSARRKFSEALNFYRAMA